MPKLIKDIKKKILGSAIDLFKEYGYAHVDMRMIAKVNSIAVGTLYNHFPNKRELFMNALEESWKETFSIFNEILLSEATPLEKVYQYIEAFYDGLSGRNGLGRELIFGDANTDNLSHFNNINSDAVNILDNIHKQLIEGLNPLIHQLVKDIQSDSHIIHRLTSSILMLTWSMLAQYPNEKEKNIEFLKYMINTTCNLSS